MEIMHPRCAGLDVHKDTVVACVRLIQVGLVQEVRTLKTTTSGLLELLDWLTTHAVTHVAMEATGVYWKPGWHVLEGHAELVLANAQHICNVPGRKTDVNDAMWIADLLAHGLIRGSFVPPAATQELRDLTRTRKQLVREIAQHTLRLQKVLEDANIKVASVLSEILGKSGRAMVKALIQGETDPTRLAELAQGHARKKRDALVEALRGRVTAHHRTMLHLHMQVIEALEATLQQVDSAVGTALEPIRDLASLLTTMPGVSHVVAQVLVAEIGTDMTRFPTPGHLISWAGLCPRSDQSAGKRRSTRIERSAVESALGLEFVRQGRNLVLLAPQGLGKTMIAQNIAYLAVQAGFSVIFTTAAQLLLDLGGTESSRALDQRLKHYSRAHLLCIDELGYLSYDNRNADLLFQIITRRYESKSIVLTTNLAFSQWPSIFPNATCTTALIDRIVHHADIISNEGDSYRRREAEAAKHGHRSAR